MYVPMYVDIYLMHVCTNASIQFKAASISFALHTYFTGRDYKVDQFDPHTVGGLNQIQVDSKSMVSGIGFKCTFCTKWIESGLRWNWIKSRSKLAAIANAPAVWGLLVKRIYFTCTIKKPVISNNRTVVSQLFISSFGNYSN